MTVRAIDVQPRAGPLVYVRAGVVRIGQFEDRSVKQRFLQNADVRQRANLVVDPLISVPAFRLRSVTLRAVVLRRAHDRIRMFLVQLNKVERQRRAGP